MLVCPHYHAGPDRCGQFCETSRTRVGPHIYILINPARMVAEKGNKKNPSREQRSCPVAGLVPMARIDGARPARLIPMRTIILLLGDEVYTFLWLCSFAGAAHSRFALNNTMFS